MGHAQEEADKATPEVRSDARTADLATLDKANEPRVDSAADVCLMLTVPL